MFSEFMSRALGQCRIDDRPSYYSGRGANMSDLNGEQLEQLYERIESGVSHEAAQAFAQMVSAIPVLSATDFLITLNNLEQAKWVWNDNLLNQTNGRSVDSEATAFATFAETMFGSRTDSTEQIRGMFLYRHGIGDRPDLYAMHSRRSAGRCR